MPQSLSKIYIHLVFHTKTTSPNIRTEDLSRVFAYIGGLVNSIGCKTIKVGGMGDHVHLLFLLSKEISLVSFVQKVKAGSSRWLSECDDRYKKFAWQNGYGAFSVSQSILEKTATYIERQREHHAKKSFKEEYLDFLRLYNVEYVEKYLFND